MLHIPISAICPPTGLSTQAADRMSTATGAARETVQNYFGHAVLTPARDLNLIRDPIARRPLESLKRAKQMDSRELN